MLTAPRHITLIAAHRGGAGLRPENSRAAFTCAIALGVDQIETDVRLTRDGEPVLIHDGTLERTTSGGGAVAHRSWAELRRIRLRGANGETIPHLDELLSVLRMTSMGLRLELKADQLQDGYSSLCARVIRSLRDHQILDRTTVSSFNWRSLIIFRALARPQGLIGLVKRDQYRQLGLNGILALARDHELHEISLHPSQFSDGAIDLAAAQDTRLGLYKVQSPDEIECALRARVSAFTTDHPDLAVEIRSGLP